MGRAEGGAYDGVEHGGEEEEGVLRRRRWGLLWWGRGGWWWEGLHFLVVRWVGMRGGSGGWGSGEVLEVGRWVVVSAADKA